MPGLADEVSDDVAMVADATPLLETATALPEFAPSTTNWIEPLLTGVLGELVSVTLAVAVKVLIPRRTLAELRTRLTVPGLPAGHENWAFTVVFALELFAKPARPARGESAVNTAVTTKRVVAVDPHATASEVRVAEADPADTATGEPELTPSTRNWTVPLALAGVTVAAATKGPVIAPEATVWLAGVTVTVVVVCAGPGGAGNTWAHVPATTSMAISVVAQVVAAAMPLPESISRSCA
jgi:hypothetical protein